MEWLSKYFAICDADLLDSGQNALHEFGRLQLEAFNAVHNLIPKRVITRVSITNVVMKDDGEYEGKSRHVIVYKDSCLYKSDEISTNKYIINK